MYRTRDEVIVKQSIGRSGPTTKEVRVGTVLAVGNEELTVSFAVPGGRMVKQIIPISDCSPVDGVFKRTSLQTGVNRQIFRGSV